MAAGMAAIKVFEKAPIAIASILQFALRGHPSLLDKSGGRHVTEIITYNRD